MSSNKWMEFLKEQKAKPENKDVPYKQLLQQSSMLYKLQQATLEVPKEQAPIPKSKAPKKAPKKAPAKQEQPSAKTLAKMKSMNKIYSNNIYDITPTKEVKV